MREVSFVPIWTQFRSAADVNHFVVRSVYEMLSLPQPELDQTVRRKDQNRLREIHKETACFLLDRDIPLEEIQTPAAYYAAEIGLRGLPLAGG